MNQHEAEKLTIKRVLVYLRRNRRQIVVFMVCLGISLLLWLMIKLNRHYVHTVTFRVNLSGMFENQRMVALQPDTVKLEIKAQGYQLLFNEVTIARSLEIDLSNTLLRPTSQPGILYISSQSLMARIATQFPVTTEMLSIKPDTLFFRVEDIETAWVKVLPDVALDFKSHHFLFDTILVKPDSILVKGSSALLAQTTSVSTRKLDLKQVDKSFSTKLNLVNPHPGQLTLNPKEVTISGKVSKFVEKFWTVQLSVPDSLDIPAALPLKLVEVQGWIPAEESMLFNTSSITVTIGKVVIEGNIRYGILQATAPPMVKKIQIHPERINLGNLYE
jgi:hypothetical protein